MTMPHRRQQQQQQQLFSSNNDNNNEDDADADTAVRASESTNRDRTCRSTLHANDDEDDDDAAGKRRTAPVPSLRLRTGGRRRWMIVTISAAGGLLLVYMMAVRGWITRESVTPAGNQVPIILDPTIGRYTTNRTESRTVLLPLTLVVTVVAAQLPPFIGAAIASSCIIAFSIITRPAVVDSSTAAASATLSTTTTTTTTITITSHHQYLKNGKNAPPPTTTTRSSNVTFATVVVSIIAMIAVLLVENFLIWVVSATFIPGHSASTAPPPLQDNGQRALNYIFHTLLQVPSKSNIVSLRRLLNTQWSLVACVGTSFVVTEVDDPRRTLYGIANRAIITVAVARFIRTISFMMTVVPSQNPNCYIQRGFPLPPPSRWIDWIWIGIIPRSHGGCNDLIVSGHATIISTLACISTSVSDDSMFAIALWSMVVMDFMVEIYEGFHYSVDMWLGIILVTLLWNVLHSLEGLPPESLVVAVPDESSTLRNPQPVPKEPVTLRGFIAYAIPGLVAYLQLIVIRQDIANIVIVCYVLSAVFVYIQFAAKKRTNSYLRQWYIHYAQHILLCLVFLALGIYL